MRKRIFSILMVLVLLCALLPMSALAADVPTRHAKQPIQAPAGQSPAVIDVQAQYRSGKSAQFGGQGIQSNADGSQTTSYNLWVGDVQVTSANASDVLGDGTVSFDPKYDTLTLNNAKIKGAVVNGEVAGIYASAMDLSLELIGSNSITCADTTLMYSNGICMYGNSLSVQGDGSLDILVGNADYAMGIYLEGYMLVSGGTLNISVPSANQETLGILSQYSLYIYDGSVTATVGDASVASAAVFSPDIYVGGGSLVARSTATSPLYAIGIDVPYDDVNEIPSSFGVDGGYVSASVAVANDYSAAIQLTDGAIYLGASCEMTGATESYYEGMFRAVQASLSTPVEIVNYGYDVWVGGTLVTKYNCKDVLGDSTVSFDPDTNTLTLNNAAIHNAEVQFEDAGIWASGVDLNIVLKGESSITGIGDPEIMYSNGICIYGGKLNISGDGILNIASGTAMNTYGIYTVEDVTVNGCTINVTGNVASKFSLGILTMSDVYINDSTLNAVASVSPDCSAVECNNLYLNGGKLSAYAAPSNGGFGTGIYTNGALVISRGSISAQCNQENELHTVMAIAVYGGLKLPEGYEFVNCLGTDATVPLYLLQADAGKPLEIRKANDSSQPGTYIMGDVNGDGTVDSSDTNMVFRYVMEDATLEPLSEIQMLAADVNGDHVVDSSDTNMLFRYVMEDSTLTWTPETIKL